MSITVGVLGAASIARRFMIRAFQEAPETTVVAIASRDTKAGMAIAEEYGIPKCVSYDALVADPTIDVIYMPLPTGLHYQWGRKCLNAGKHILFEKSLGSTHAEVISLIELARSKHLLIDENFMFECHPQQSVLRERLVDLGELRNICVSFGFPPLPDTNFRYQRDLGGGALLDAGAYTLKFFEVVFPDWELEIKQSVLKGNLEVDLHGSVFALLTKGTSMVPCLMGFGFDNYYQCGVKMWGQNGYLSTDRTFTAGPEIRPNIILEQEGSTETYGIESANHFTLKVSSFIAELNGKSYESRYSKLLKQSLLIEKVRHLSV